MNRRPSRFRYFFSPPDIAVVGSAIRTRFAVERSDEFHAVDRVGILNDRFYSCVIGSAVDNGSRHSRGAYFGFRENAVGVIIFNRTFRRPCDLRERHSFDACPFRQRAEPFQIVALPLPEPIGNSRAVNSLPVDNRFLLRFRQLFTESFLAYFLALLRERSIEFLRRFGRRRLNLPARLGNIYASGYNTSVSKEAKETRQCQKRRPRKRI